VDKLISKTMVDMNTFDVSRQREGMGND